MNSEPQVWSAGTLLQERYRLLRALRGEVRGQRWLAQDLLRDRRQVVCHKGPAWQPPVSLEALVHPHLARVLRVARPEDPEPFWVEAFIDGESLFSLRGRVAPRVTRILLIQALHALAYLEHQGVLPRSLSPGCMRLVWQPLPQEQHPRPVIYLLGQGAAPTQEEGAARNLFTAPEVLLGEPATASSVLFSLGASLYLGLTGEAPYQQLRSEPAQVLHSDPPRGWPEGIDPVLRGVLEKMLAPQRQGRYAHAVQALDALLGSQEHRLPLSTFDLQGGALVAHQAFVDRFWRSLPQSPRWALLGEVGMGRARVLREVEGRMWLQGQQALRLKVRPGGAPYMTAVALVEQIRRAQGVVRPVRRGSLDEEGLERSLVRALVQLMQEQPHDLVMIESLEQADHWSLQVLRRWLERDTQTPVLISGHHLPRGWESLFQHMIVPPLTRQQVVSYLQDNLGEGVILPALIRRLVDDSQGVPSRLRLLCVTLLEQGVLQQDIQGRMSLVSPSWETPLERTERQRLERLHPNSRGLLESLVTWGRVLPEESARVWGDAESLEDLWRRGLVRIVEGERGRWLRAPASQLSQVVTSMMSPERLAEVHLQLGHRLARGWLYQGEGAAEAAYHLRQSGQPCLASALWYCASHEARREGSLDSARQWLRVAQQGAEAPEAHSMMELELALLALEEGEVQHACEYLLRASQGTGYAAWVAPLLLWEVALHHQMAALERSCARWIKHFNPLRHSLQARLMSLLSDHRQRKLEPARPRALHREALAQGQGLVAQRALFLEVGAYLQRGQLERAWELVKEPAAQPSSALEQAVRGWVMFLRGELQRGVHLMERAAPHLKKPRPEMALERDAILLHLSRAWLTLGEPRRAQEALRRLVKLRSQMERSRPDPELRALELARRILQSQHPQECASRLEVLARQLEGEGALEQAMRVWQALGWGRGPSAALAQGRAEELASQLDAGFLREIQALRPV